MDTNTVAAVRAVLHADPQHIATELAAWGSLLSVAAFAVGRACHAFKTGAGKLAAVFQGTNAPVTPPGLPEIQPKEGLPLDSTRVRVQPVEPTPPAPPSALVNPVFTQPPNQNKT